MDSITIGTVTHATIVYNAVDKTIITLHAHKSIRVVALSDASCGRGRRRQCPRGQLEIA